ncbi:unnamed protein product, partial [Didymodactylos carnosus]
MVVIAAEFLFRSSLAACNCSCATSSPVSHSPPISHSLPAPHSQCPSTFKWSLNGRVVAGSVSGSGSSLTQLMHPTGIFVDRNQNVYVVDESRVQLWLKQSKSGKTVASRGLADLEDILADDKGNMFIATVNFILYWKKGASSSSRTISFMDRSIFRYMCFDGANNLYVTDSGQNQVLKYFAPGYVSKVIVGGDKNGIGGKGMNQLNGP